MPNIYIPPTPPDLAFLYVIGMGIILLVLLALLFLIVRNDIWDKQHSI
jgi:hypothetical protein